MSAGVKGDIVDFVLVLFDRLAASPNVEQMSVSVGVFVDLLLQRTDWGADRDGMGEARGAAMCSTEAEKCL